MTKADYCQQQIVRILRDTLVILAISVALGCGKSGSQATGGHSTPGASTAHASGQINNESDPIPSNLPSVRVAVVEGDRMLRRIEVTGTLESESFVEIMPEIPGTVVERRAEEGDRAQAGQILAVLDKTEIEIEVKRAQANLQQRQAELSQLLAGNRTEDIAVARAARDRAKAGHDNMLRNRERYQALHEKKIFTDKDWDDFIAQLDQARENLEAAEAELSKAQTGPRREEIEKARASVAAASADLALSRKRLSDTEIKAPFNGIISKRYLEVGERVETNRPVFSIYDDTALRVSVTVPENYIGVLAQGQRCEITVPAYPGEIFEGTVRVVGEQLDVTTRSLPVKVIVKSKEHRLLPGMFARVTVEMGWIDQAVVIPRDAVRFREGMPIAFVVKDGRAYERALDLGQSSMDQIHVQSGISVGESIVVSDISDLTDNQQVNITQAETGEAS